VSSAVESRRSSVGWSPAATRFALLNATGGAAVLASYAWGLSWLGSDASRAWGGVPEALRPIYQVSMLLAAAGYFPMTLFVLAGERSGRTATASATTLYAAILVGSAAWLPLTCVMLEQPSTALWWAIRLDLAVVGAASLGVLALVARARPPGSPLAWKAAVAGAVLFCVQTALLDALVWPAYFPGAR
jgi:hypothetical protein